MARISKIDQFVYIWQFFYIKGPICFNVIAQIILSVVFVSECTFFNPLSIALVTPTALIIGSVDEIQKLHVRTLPLEETPKRLALQSETSSLGVITYRQEMFQEGMGFKPVRSSISLSQKIPKSASRLPKTAPCMFPCYA